MSLNQTPASERVHIGIFGRRNAGKSSLINALTNQDTAVVSEIAGTTTDPVSKAMEILPLGPVVITDTPGLDDEGEIGGMRVEKTRKIIGKTDIAIVVIDINEGEGECERELFELLAQKHIPCITVYNKCDTTDFEKTGKGIYISAKNGYNIDKLRDVIAGYKVKESGKRIIGDILKKGDIAVLVTPIDEAAPKGRLILPQQQTIRDILDSGAINVVVREHELAAALDALSKKPYIVITDSQAFSVVSEIVPEDIYLTSFSILFARYKGQLNTLVEGARAIERLADGDKVLISEGCTHKRQCGDIGSVKIPKLLNGYTKKKLSFEFTSGGEFPDNLSEFALVVHCGGCMLNEREMNTRIDICRENGVNIVNYGVAIAYMKGILKRSLKIFEDVTGEIREELQ